MYLISPYDGKEIFYGRYETSGHCMQNRPKYYKFKIKIKEKE